MQKRVGNILRNEKKDIVYHHKKKKNNRTIDKLYEKWILDKKLEQKKAAIVNWACRCWFMKMRVR